MKSLLTLDGKFYIEVRKFKFHCGQTETRLASSFGDGRATQHPIQRNITEDTFELLADTVLDGGPNGILVASDAHEYHVRFEGEERCAQGVRYIGTVTRHEQLPAESFNNLYAKYVGAGAN
ncbi:MAG: hypothetical protein ABL962_15070 [Fimbriimonadaceae bacterium]